LGDTVNLSARLEGLNKRYGTSLLMSAETLLGNPQRGGFRRVERVRVKGRDKPVEVYTPCADPWTIETGDRAIDLYLARNWAASSDLWRAIQARDPTDRLAAYYLGHINEMEKGDLTVDWNGVESTAEK
jgi:adenylate cyclase